MIIHEENDAPMEVPAITSSHSDAKRYIIVKNHVRELPINDSNEHNADIAQEEPPSTHKKKKKSKKPKNDTVTSQSESSSNTENKPTEIETSSNTEKPTEISECDLEELRTVYKKCKDVIERIEIKYGHLLGLEGTLSSETQNNEVSNECTCGVKKKIIFDDDGQQLLTDAVLDKHVCPKKLKRRHSELRINNENLQVEYEESVMLPDNLQSLSNILQDPDIHLTYRNKVIHKMKAIKMEHSNDIKFDKPSLIEKLKRNADEVLDFKGTNLASLPGYPDWKK